MGSAECHGESTCFCACSMTLSMTIAVCSMRSPQTIVNCCAAERPTARRYARGRRDAGRATRDASAEGSGVVCRRDEGRRVTSGRDNACVSDREGPVWTRRFLQFRQNYIFRFATTSSAPSYNSRPQSNRSPALFSPAYISITASCSIDRHSNSSHLYPVLCSHLNHI